MRHAFHTPAQKTKLREELESWAAVSSNGQKLETPE